MVKTHWENYQHSWRVFYVNIYPGPWITLGNPENSELAGYIHIYISIYIYIIDIIIYDADIRGTLIE